MMKQTIRTIQLPGRVSSSAQARRGETVPGGNGFLDGEGAVRGEDESFIGEKGRKGKGKDFHGPIATI